MTTITYTDPTQVADTRITATPTYGRTASGYGPKLPTRYMIRYLGVWRRVYVMQYGNSGSAYVIVRGVDTFLNTDTEHRLAGDA